MLKDISLPPSTYAKAFSQRNNLNRENTEKVSELNKAVLDLDILSKLPKNDTLIKIKELCDDLKKLISEYTEQPPSQYAVAYSKPQKYNPAHIRPNLRA